jgi:hypothetical protein
MECVEAPAKAAISACGMSTSPSNFHTVSTLHSNPDLRNCLHLQQRRNCIGSQDLRALQVRGGRYRQLQHHHQEGMPEVDYSKEELLVVEML